MQKALINWANEIEQQRARLVLHPAHAELVGARFLNALGIRTAEVKLIPQREAQQLSAEWIQKFHVDTRALVIRKIPGAISLNHLAELHGIRAAEPEWRYPLEPDGALAVFVFDAETALQDTFGGFGEGGAMAYRFSRLFARHADIIPRNILALMTHGKRWQVPDAKQFFSDFQPANMEVIKAAIAWNSEQMLKLHAGRLLLGCTLAHAGNVLVDGAGRLYSIDHEKIEHSDGSDIEMLAQHMKPGTRAWRAVCDVANVSQPEAIWQLFDDVGLDWPLGSRSATVEYFENRVRRFQEHFQQ